MTEYFADLHCHSTLFCYNRLYPNTWFERYFPIFPAQGDFAQLARGKVRVVMVSLYPIEQGFVTAKPLGLGTGNLTDFLAKVVVDIPKSRADEIQLYDHDYFDDLMKELDFLNQSAYPVTRRVYQNPYRRKRYNYRIVKDYNSLKALLEIDDNYRPGNACDQNIAVILTMEGAHSLGIGQKNTLYKDETFLIHKLKENIGRLKKLGPPGDEGAWCPFFITLSHHFWNQLGGHAVSLWKTIRKVLDQSPGINEGITELGKIVVDELLSTENGRRILIDSAHMSYHVRKWYYRYLEERGDAIPVIISHTAVNGFATLDEAQMHGNPDVIHDVADELYDQSTRFNPWDDFVSDEEIMIVHQSGGLIGLIMDQRIMTGKETLEETKRKARFRSRWNARKVWIQPFINQVVHIAGHILSLTGDSDTIWDNICLGTDFNGMITPIKSFDNANKMPFFQKTFTREMIKRATSEPSLAGKTEEQIKEIVDKILWKNNLVFLERHFH